MVHPNYRDKEHKRKWLETKQKIIEYFRKKVGWKSIKEIQKGTISKDSPKGINPKTIRKHMPELVKEKVVEYHKGIGFQSTSWIRLDAERYYGEPEEIRRLKEKMIDGLVDGLKNGKCIIGYDEGVHCFLPDLWKNKAIHKIDEKTNIIKREPTNKAIHAIDREIKESLCKILSKGLKKYPITESNNLTFAFLVDVKEFKKYMKAKERTRQINATEKPSS